MSYVENNLMKDEKVIHSTKQHWIIFLGPVLFIGLGIWLFAQALGKAGDEAAGSSGIGMLLLLVGVIYFIMEFIRFKTNEFAVTNKRIIVKIGLIRRVTLEMNLEKVESVGVNQPVLGRILNYGTIMISGTGSTKQPFKDIDKPMEFKKVVQGN